MSRVEWIKLMTRSAQEHKAKEAATSVSRWRSLVPRPKLRFPCACLGDSASFDPDRRGGARLVPSTAPPVLRTSAVWKLRNDSFWPEKRRKNDAIRVAVPLFSRFCKIDQRAKTMYSTVQYTSTSRVNEPSGFKLVQSPLEKLPFIRPRGCQLD
jgi:hypothetical protein